VAHYWVDTWTVIKNLKKFKKILKKIQKNHEVTHDTPGLTHVHLKKIQKNSKNNSKKPRSDTWQSLFMAVNDLNGVSKKGPN